MLTYIRGCCPCTISKLQVPQKNCQVSGSSCTRTHSAEMSVPLGFCSSQLYYVVGIDESYFSHVARLVNEGREQYVTITVIHNSRMVEVMVVLNPSWFLEWLIHPSPQPVMKAHIHPNMTIWSDRWTAYLQVRHLPTVMAHGNMNYSVHFRYPATGVHTNHIDSYWNWVKLRLKRMKGCHHHLLDR